MKIISITKVRLTMKKIKISYLLCLITASALLSPFSLFAQSISVLQWGPENDVVTGFFNQNRNNIAVDLGTPMSPNIGAQGYYQGGDPVDASAVFYGSLYNSTDDGVSRLQIPDSINPNPLTFDFSNGTDSSATRVIAGLALWQKPDGFLSSETFSFADLSLSLDHYVNASTARGEVRFVVRDGASDFYVSNDLGTLEAASAGVASETDVVAWYGYDPTVSILDFGVSAAPSLADITALGFLYVKEDDFTTANFRVSEFSATAIPEPSTYAALLGFAAFALVVVRRRMKKNSEGA
ncbi:MAG: PEP-CTERM sorting domain-containing protein [Opitutales bacterium]|nr:PEP-CTERM sorting domain-containing protein [Opitutales bacterium]